MTENHIEIFCALHSFSAPLQSMKYWPLCSLGNCGWWPFAIKELLTALQLSMYNLIHLPRSSFWYWHQLPWQQGMSLHRDGLLQLDMPSAVECSIAKKYLKFTYHENTENILIACCKLSTIHKSGSVPSLYTLSKLHTATQLWLLAFFVKKEKQNNYF